jgi:hypothetical protein
MTATDSPSGTVAIVQEVVPCLHVGQEHRILRGEAVWDFDQVGGGGEKVGLVRVEGEYPLALP